MFQAELLPNDNPCNGTSSSESNGIEDVPSEPVNNGHTLETIQASGKEEEEEEVTQEEEGKEVEAKVDPSCDDQVAVLNDQRNDASSIHPVPTMMPSPPTVVEWQPVNNGLTTESTFRPFTPMISKDELITIIDDVLKLTQEEEEEDYEDDEKESTQEEMNNLFANEF